MNVSVIVPTYKRSQYLRRCLESLLKQVYHPLEIILAISADDQETCAAIEEIRESVDNSGVIQQVVVDKQNIVYAENHGLEIARGEIVCFIDDDAFAPDDWISSIVVDFESDPNTGGVGGPIIPFIDGAAVIKYTDSFARMSWWGRRNNNTDKIPYRLEEVYSLRGANMSFKRELLGFFDENLLPYWRRFEDDVCLTIRGKGYKIISDPKVRVFHHQVTTDRESVVDKTKEMIIGLHHNSIYVKLKHFKGLRKIAMVCCELFLGDKTCPGIFPVIFYGIRHLRPQKFLESIYALTGKIKGVKTYLNNK
ncbi:MAG: glycosyltransferase family A protein [Candidatus Omnitrophota bacterium]|nr:glycosyltransferase family 2 protein [Candidatus Omnitrophota bacterium]MBU1928479.1 glycosyltransferase family 2 protein [Candidatus Omnitrophota bacterium]MBU2035448.1 glycosyltransferase family 2 protein [Candidatus Omnitrophota bacterium]MBU2257871.1 glycosyltransferase family 2 protein [Candidatus Omnitrophota bacterium]